MRRYVERGVLPLAAATLGLLAALAVVGCKGSDDRAQAPAATHADSQAEAVFNVQGMHCATCPVTVRTAAKGVAGVVDARVSMDDARAWVTYDALKTSPTAIAQAITDSGYPATVRNEPSVPDQPSAGR